MSGMSIAFASHSSHPTIVFDLDGTLAETAPDIIGTLNTILEREGLAALPVSKARDLVGAGAKALIERGFKLYERPLRSMRWPPADTGSLSAPTSRSGIRGCCWIRLA
jgi:hypothetical protein